jgi:hypothetical protein
MGVHPSFGIATKTRRHEGFFYKNFFVSLCLRGRSVVLLIALAAGALSGLSAQSRPSLVAIRGGTILTVTKGTIQNGTVLLRDGKIAAVGTNVSPASSSRRASSTATRTSPRTRSTKAARRSAR